MKGLVQTMIQVELSVDEFAYDVRSLIQAFYPGKKLVFLDKNQVKKEKAVLKEEIELKVSIKYGDHDIFLSFCKKEAPSLEKYERIKYDSDTGNIEPLKGKLNLTTEQRKIYKNHLKRLLYTMLSELTGKTLPWGTLTGIRPTKIPMKMIEEHYEVPDIKKRMTEEYLCTDEKADLCVDIAGKEYGILKEIDYKNGYSIYIGIPFCPTTCLYCSFTSYSVEKYKDQVEAYLEALFKEIDFISLRVHNKRLVTVYIGGGTPTTLNARQLERLLIKIRTSFPMEDVREFTVEAGRPDSITMEKLKVLKEQGITRISINPQTMNQDTLDVIGRKHTVRQIIDAFYMARKTGYNNINMDLIAGLPGENYKDFLNTIKEIDQLKPDSLTVHTLAIKRAARLNVNRERYMDIMPTDTGEMLRLCNEYTKEALYEPYYLYRQKNMTDNLENIGYAQRKKEGIYNILIMEEKHTIIALGAGASSKFVSRDGESIERSENVKSVKDYIERVDEMMERKHLLMEKYCY